MALELIGLQKSFGSVTAVKNVTLTIREGEFFSLLGPSGCGKTTLLRMIGGFETPTGGEIRHDGRRVDLLPPHQRHFNMVFQRYALFPHLDVERNIAFGLEMKKVPRPEIHRRTQAILELVRMEGYGKRAISTLSGGQQQRIALARALVNEPKVLLLDEPLSALDLKLRQQMQVELRALQRRIGHTFIFVTHDQEEALTLSDRIAVMNQGRIEQIGTGQEIYERPDTEFVARFIGTINTLETPAGVLAIRPEKIQLQREEAYRAVPGSPGAVSAIVKDVLFQGPTLHYVCELNGTSQGPWLCIRPNSPGEAQPRPGERVMLSWREADAKPLRPGMGA